MPNRNLETRVRDALHEQADSRFLPLESSPSVAIRAKRRRIRNAIATSALAVLILAVLIAGPVRAMVQQTPSPAVPGPVPTLFSYFVQTPDRFHGTYVVLGSGPARRVSRFAPAGWFPDGGSVLVYGGPEHDRVLRRVSVPSGRLLRFPEIVKGGVPAPKAIRLDGWTVNQPELSPDGRSLVLAASTSPAGGPGVYVTNLFGEDARRLYAGLAYEPSWSPDGTQVAFADTNSVIEIASVDGSGRQSLPLPNLNRALAGYPAFSPDGHEVVFGVELHGLWLVDENGTLSQLTDSGDVAAWSPDGTSVAFEDRGADQSDIFSADVATGAVTTLSNSPGRTQLMPKWWFPPVP